MKNQGIRWRREGDLKISASLETLKIQGRSDVPLPVYPEVYPSQNTLRSLQDYVNGDNATQAERVWG